MSKFFVFFIIITIGHSIGAAQESNPLPAAPPKSFQTNLEQSKQSKNKAAQEKYVEGEVADENKDFKTAAQKFREAIELDPDFFAAHEAFIKASFAVKTPARNGKTLSPDQENPAASETGSTPLGDNPAGEMLTKTYRGWTAKYPKKAVMHWGLGNVLLEVGDTKLSENAFRRAVAVNQKFAPAYESLAKVAAIDQNQEARRENLRLAYEYDRTADRLYQYASSLDNDRQRQSALYPEIVKQYPTSKNAYDALLALASITSDESERLNYLEKIWRMFPNEKTGRHNSTMQVVFMELSGRKPETALELADAMTKIYPQDQLWKNAAARQTGIVKAKNLVAGKQYAAAAGLLKTLKPGVGSGPTLYYLLRAEAESGGDLQKEYDLLLGSAAQKFYPTLNEKLYSDGAKLGKSKAQIENDLWQQRVAQAKTFKDFELVRHDTNQPVKLSDFRGKVVFLSFWFPGCSPCIAEFPYLRAAMEKYKSQGLEIVFINMFPDQDSQAISVLKEHQMDVISLKIPTNNWAKDEYGIYAAPTNFLIDTEGKIIFQPEARNAVEARDFDKQLELLINHRNADSKAAAAK